MNSISSNLRSIYKLLHKRFGPQYWWPGETSFEIIVGAILTQNTNWQNVEKAIRNLNVHGLLSPKKLKSISHGKLAGYIRPAGYFNLKAKRLKHFMKFLFKDFDGSLKRMFKENPVVLRKKLLNVNGIGPETADSILLYAGNMPVFVVDAYTKRILHRHNIIDHDAGYEKIQMLFTNNLPNRVKLFNEYHALIVRTGKEYCRKTPSCNKCPLSKVSK